MWPISFVLAQLVEALRYKPEGHGFDSQRCHWNFYWRNLSGPTRALRSTQPLTEMSTRNFLEGRGGRCAGLTTLPPSCADCLEIWEPQYPGTLRACPGLQWGCFTLTSFVTSRRYYNARPSGRLRGYDLYRCFPNFFARWPHMASKNNDGSSHPSSSKYSLSGW